MFHGRFCRAYSATKDCFIQREVGNQTLDEFAISRLFDAASPEQLDALAFQFLCLARRCKTSGSHEVAKAWKGYYTRATAWAAAARARLAVIPTKASAPALFNPRTPGKPGCLDSDFNLPFLARIDIGDTCASGIYTGTYTRALAHWDVIAIQSSRHGKTWITRLGSTQPIEIATATLRGLQQLGRLVAREPIATIAA